MNYTLKLSPQVRFNSAMYGKYKSLKSHVAPAVHFTLLVNLISGKKNKTDC